MDEITVRLTDEQAKGLLQACPGASLDEAAFMVLTTAIEKRARRCRKAGQVIKMHRRALKVPGGRG